MRLICGHDASPFAPICAGLIVMKSADGNSGRMVGESLALWYYDNVNLHLNSPGPQYPQGLTWMTVAVTAPLMYLLLIISIAFYALMEACRYSLLGKFILLCALLVTVGMKSRKADTGPSN